MIEMWAPLVCDNLGASSDPAARAAALELIERLALEAVPGLHVDSRNATPVVSAAQDADRRDAGTTVSSSASAPCQSHSPPDYVMLFSSSSSSSSDEDGGETESAPCQSHSSPDYVMLFSSSSSSSDEEWYQQKAADGSDEECYQASRLQMAPSCSTRTTVASIEGAPAAECASDASLRCSERAPAKAGAQQDADTEAEVPADILKLPPPVLAAVKAHCAHCVHCAHHNQKRALRNFVLALRKLKYLDGRGVYDPTTLGTNGQKRGQARTDSYREVLRSTKKSLVRGLGKNLSIEALKDKFKSYGMDDTLLDELGLSGIEAAAKVSFAKWSQSEDRGGHSHRGARRRAAMLMRLLTGEPIAGHFAQWLTRRGLQTGLHLEDLMQYEHDNNPYFNLDDYGAVELDDAATSLANYQASTPVSCRETPLRLPTWPRQLLQELLKIAQRGQRPDRNGTLMASMRSAGLTQAVQDFVLVVLEERALLAVGCMLRKKTCTSSIVGVIVAIVMSRTEDQGLQPERLAQGTRWASTTHEKVQKAITIVAERMVGAGRVESLPAWLRPRKGSDGRLIYRPCCCLYSDASLDWNSDFADEYLRYCSQMFIIDITRDTIKNFCRSLGDGDSQAGWAIAQTVFHWTFNRKTDHIDEVPHKASAAAALRLALGDATSAQLGYRPALRSLLVLYGKTTLGKLRFVREAEAGLKQDNFLPVGADVLRQLNELLLEEQ